MGGQPALEQQPSDHFVNGVVPTDVLADERDRSRAVEDGSGVHTAGGGEELLLRSDLVGNAGERLHTEWLHGQPVQPVGQRRDGLGATEATGAAGGPQPRCRFGGEPTGLDGDDVEVGLHRAPGAAVTDAGHGGTGEQPLCVAEAHGQVEIVSRCAHRRGHERPVELDGQRLLDDEFVGPAAEIAVGVPERQHLLRSTSRHEG